VATATGFAVTLTIAFVTTRYLADFLPFLALGGVIGLQLLLDWGRGRALVLAGTAALVMAGVAINGGAGLVEQRLLYEATEHERAGFVDAQDAVDRFLGRSPHGISSGTELPQSATGAPGDLFVVGDCGALYVQGLHNDWLPVERTARGGRHRLLVRFGAADMSGPQALLRFDTRPPVAVTALRRLGETRLSVRVGRKDVATSRPLSIPAGRPVPVVVSIDRFSGGTFVAVDVGARRVVTSVVPEVAGARVALGAPSGGAGAFDGSVQRVNVGAPVCRALARRAGLARVGGAPAGPA
jgi:hypothetical protein